MGTKIYYASPVGSGGQLPVFPPPVIVERAPTSTDTDFPPGQVWVQNNVNPKVIFQFDGSSWQGGGGSAGSFNSLTVNGATTINSATNATNIATDASTGAINIGTGAGARIITIGNGTGATAVNILSGSAGITLTAKSLLKTDAAVQSVASPTATGVSSVNTGNVQFTGFTTAAGSSQDFTITNTLVTTASVLLVTVCNEGSNDAQMNITRIQRLAGSFIVTVKNDGAAALNGNVGINWWLMKA